MRDDEGVRTTLDEDVLQAAKKIAARRGTTAGKILSELARKGLARRKRGAATRHGVPLLPRREGERAVTLEDVNRLRDDNV